MRFKIAHFTNQSSSTESVVSIFHAYFYKNKKKITENYQTKLRLAWDTGSKISCFLDPWKFSEFRNIFIGEHNTIIRSQNLGAKIPQN